MSMSESRQRRHFLMGLGGLLAGGAASAVLPQMDLVGRALAASPQAVGDDYRALVCIFLFGGNDSFNMLIPHAQDEYAIYEASRVGIHNPGTNPLGLAIARDALGVITDRAGKSWGLNPECAAMKPLFDAGELAFLANVGTLVEPITKAEFRARGKAFPSYLYSHNDQQRQWMRGHSTNTRIGNGWGGMAGDRLARFNSGLSALPPTISIAGNNLYQSGASVLPYAVAQGGPTRLNYFRADSGNADRIRREALASLVQASYPPVMASHFGVVGESSMVVNEALRVALDPANGGDIATAFPQHGLANQLRMIARMIKVSQGAAIGHKRQIFFASLGGFDTHENQMAANNHPRLLRELSTALAAFRDGLNEIGMQRNVVTFTMSDFARTLNSNGNGTDHAWGGVQLVMGGAAPNGGPVHGRRVWGDYPLLELDGAQSVGRGRMIPTMSLQQMGATLAGWMGVAESDLDLIFPGLGNFPTRRLGFLG